MDAHKYARWAERFSILYLSLSTNLRIYRARRILDVGCGPGIFEREMRKVDPEAEVIGIDINPEMCRLSRSIVADAKQLPFRDESFDMAVMIYSLHSAGFEVLDEIRRCLRKEGILFIRDLNIEMPNFVKNLLLGAIERDVGRDYANVIKDTLFHFPEPEAVLREVGKRFDVLNFSDNVYYFDIISKK